MPRTTAAPPTSSVSAVTHTSRFTFRNPNAVSALLNPGRPMPPQSPNTCCIPCAKTTPPTANRSRTRPKSVPLLHVSSRRFGRSNGWVVAPPRPDPGAEPTDPDPLSNNEVGWSLMVLPSPA